MGGTWLPNSECSSADSKYRFTEVFRKDDSIWDFQAENCCSSKSGKQLLAEANCEYIRMPGSNTFCSPDHVYSGYLGDLSDRKGR